MIMNDISRRITRKSLKAKRKAAIKTIKAQAKEKIRLVKLECSIDAEQKKAKVAEKDQKKELKAQKANARVSYNARQPRPFSLGEDLFNSISHGIGAGLSVAAVVLLVIRSVYNAPSSSVASWTASYAMLGSVFFLMYLSSTLAHAITAPDGRKVFSVLNYCFIYMLIASTFTPFAMKTFHGTTLTAFVAVLWSACGIFLALHAVFFKKFKMTSAFIFAVSGILLTAYFSAGGTLLITGTVMYMAGGFFFLFRNYKWSHSIFHFFALAGSIFHFFAVYYLIG